MKISIIIAVLTAGVFTYATVFGQNVLTSDTRLACEAILCLSSGQRPGECSPSLARYFSISYSRISDTIRGRVDFLNLCPVPSIDANMKSLVDVIANGAGRCDAAALNAQLMTSYGSDSGGGYSIGNAMPSYCAAYTTHAYTQDLQNNQAVYVGSPDRNGFWVEKSGYAAALADYNGRIAKEDAGRAASSQGGGG